VTLNPSNRILLTLSILAIGSFGYGNEKKSIHKSLQSKACQRDLTVDPDLLIANKNANILQTQYTQYNFRDLNFYREYFGKDFTSALSTLENGGRHLDVGSGYGISSFTLTNELSSTSSVAINSQNAWSFIDRIPENDTNVDPFFNPYAPQNPIYDEIAESLGGNLRTIMIAAAMGISAADLANTYEIVYDTSDDSEHPVFRKGFARYVLERIRQTYKSKINSGLVSYEVGFAENIIPQLPSTFNLITDVFGAYFYSVDRVFLLDQYLNKLSPGGRAFIILNASDLIENRPEHFGVISTLINTKKNFEVDLTEKYPEIFSIQSRERRGRPDSETIYLRINKPKEPHNLNLSTNYSVESHNFNLQYPPLMKQIPQIQIREISD